MRKILSILCAACALILTFSCSKEAPASLEVAPIELTWEWDDVTPQTVAVTANKEWTATVSEEAYWTLTPASDGKSLTIAPKTDNTGIGMDVTATVTITSAELVKTVILTHKGGPFVNGHEYVDLGLPSGLLWATCNLGASKPEEYGFYYGWGTDVYAEGYEANWGYYFYCLGAKDYSATMDYCGTDKDPLKDYLRGSKYSRASEAGKADGIGGTEWDSARKTWMGEWRMPTIAEFKEIKDANNCTWEWTTLNNVKGYTVTSKKNGNSIFLPAAGVQTTSLDFAGKQGYYWSSTFDNSQKQYAAYFSFDASGPYTGQTYRIYGQSIRPVVMK